MADEELAKREAERARQREFERNVDESDEEGPSRRKRSESRDSALTTSTRASRSPGFGPPARGRASVSPPRRAAGRAYESPSPAGRAPRRDSYGSDEGGPRGPNHRYPSRSISPEARLPEKPMSPVQDIRSPQPRYSTRSASPDDGPAHGRRRKYSSSPSRSPPPENQRRRFRSRSPGLHEPRGRSPPRHRDNSAEGRGGDHRAPRGQSRNRGRGAPPPRREAERERSLSPFSKRLALTQAMNMGH